MSLKLNSSGGGSVTLQEPTTASNVTLNLPAADATVLTDSAGVLNIGSGQVYKDASGNVGIGTSSPSVGGAYSANNTLTIFGGTNSGVEDTAYLEIGSSTNTNDYQTGGIAFYNDDNSGAGSSTRKQTAIIRALCATTDSNADDDSGGTLVFITKQEASTLIERARIDSSGNLLVNQTSQSSSSKLAVAFSDATNQGIGVKNTGGSGGRFIQFLSSGGSEIGSIQQNGASATSYVTSSDYRLKENVQPMTGALAKVAALKPCTYAWKVDGEASQGFIAHELAEVVPECVTGEKDAVNEDGSIKPQGIDTSFLVATLTAAIQELKAEVDALRAQVEAQ
jgi:hypothetical protein